MTTSVRLEEFDVWRPGYGFASVAVLIGGTTQLASIFLDEALTQAAANPQTLIQQTTNGISYGKWPQPLYTGQPYELSINSVDRTGVVQPPIATLEGQDASEATVIPTGATVAGNLDDICARRIDVRDYGTFTAANLPNASAATNTNTLVAAIGVAAAAGGGYVEIPGGTYAFTNLSIPQGVKLRGIARGATVLQSTQANAVVTLTGQDAGFETLTLDGVNQTSGSIGVFAANIDFIHMHDVMVQRFSIGFQRFGGTGSHFVDLFISDCSTAGYQAHGFSDNGAGGAITNERWDGGKVELCAGIGIDLQYVDAVISGLIFSGIGFDTNTGTGAQALGGQQIKFDENCWWAGNTVDLLIDDATGNTTEGVEIQDCSFAAAIAAIPASGSTAASPATQGTITLSNTLAGVAFRRCDLSDTAININTPSNNVLVEDCDEMWNISLGGSTPTAWFRRKSFLRGATAGLTTGNSATTAWAYTLDPGQRAYLEAKVVARSRNTADDGFWHFTVSVHRPGSILSYTVETNPFTAGNVLTGQSSGATARITGVTTSGQNGTLTLQDIDGTFVSGEIITDTGNGSAHASGTPAPQNAALVGSVTTIRSAQITDNNWAATFAVTGYQVVLNVTGDTNYNVEWQVDVDMVPLG